ncbi:MAG: lipopolysaccharide heptosyltransferase II [Desulfococcaceae bacterium]
MKKIYSGTVRRILIRAANWVGDAVMSTPMIRAVRGNFPHAEIYILAKPWVSPVFENSPDIDKILIYEAAGRHKGVPGILPLAKDLRAYDFDMAFLVQNAFEAALISFLAGIPIRIGYNTDGRTPLLTHAVSMSRKIKKRHQIDYYLGILEGTGLHTFGREMNLEISVSERKQAAEILSRHGIRAEKGIIGINPGAAYGSAKRWPKDRYAQLCAQLRQVRKDMPVIVFGGPGEEKLGQDICRIAGEGCISIAGQTGLREAISLIERCRLFITNDSGLMHVAAALHVPQIAIFGPTDHSTTSPADSGSRIVRVPTPCSPCLKQECPLGHHQCMKAVSADMVFREAEQILK